MKTFMLFSFLFCLLFFETQAQDIFSDVPIEDVSSEIFGLDPGGPQMLRGGKEKTASGTLRILVVFIRYLDDTENTGTWPNYSVLPSWAQTFVDPAIPANNIFTSLNLSDFFDRSSGGNGSGTLGTFHVIGDVVYVTTTNNRLTYASDKDVFLEVLGKLDNPHGSYRINFKLYDNWQFQKNGYSYNHEYNPGVGDGIVDHIFMLNRYLSRSSVSAEKTLGLDTNVFRTNDGVVINNTAGSRVFSLKNTITPYAVGGPAHEYGHYIFGGSQITGHWDGYSYNTNSNRGRINKFALMCAVNAGWWNAYERYRAGWLNPYIVQSNTTRILSDTYLYNDAIIVPLRDPYLGSWREFYLIENYQTQRSHSSANPFIVDNLFDESYISNGLLVFHIENQDFLTPTNSEVNILCADGKWTWKLLTGASTPYNRSDDLIGKDVPMRYGNFDVDCTLNIRHKDKQLSVD